MTEHSAQGAQVAQGRGAASSPTDVLRYLGAIRSGRDYFEPETGVLVWHCTLPPPDNQCHTSAPGGMRFATKVYKAWLEEWGPALRELLGDWEPDAVQWWSVQVNLRLGSSGDAQNYLKPLLDALTGSCINPETFTDADGKKVYKGKLLKPGGLWDDDRRVVGGWSVVAVNDPNPGLTLVAQPLGWSPRDLKAEAAAERQNARQTAQNAREAALAAKEAELAQKRRAAEEKERFRWFAQSWTWTTLPGKPRTLSVHQPPAQERCYLEEVGPLEWRDKTTGDVLRGTVAQVKKAWVRERWATLPPAAREGGRG